MARRKIIAPQAAAECRVTDLSEEAEDSAAKAEQGDQDTPEHRRRLASVDRRQSTNPDHFSSLAQRVAGEQMYLRNFAWPGGRASYPEDIDAGMRFVSKYFPYTKFGYPLYVDEPISERQVILAYEKQKILRKAGLKIIVIEQQRQDRESGKPIEATTLADCLEQLGELG